MMVYHVKVTALIITIPIYERVYWAVGGAGYIYQTNRAERWTCRPSDQCSSETMRPTILIFTNILYIKLYATIKNVLTSYNKILQEVIFTLKKYRTNILFNQHISQNDLCYVSKYEVIDMLLKMKTKSLGCFLVGKLCGTCSYVNMMNHTSVYSATAPVWTWEELTPYKNSLRINWLKKAHRTVRFEKSSSIICLVFCI